MSICLIVGSRRLGMSPPLAGLAELQYPHQWNATFDFERAITESHASALRPLTDQYRYVVLVGKRVADLFHKEEMANREWFRWGTLPCDDEELKRRLKRPPGEAIDAWALSEGPACAIVPDPHGDADWWASPINCLKARKWWTELAKGATDAAFGQG